MMQWMLHEWHLRVINGITCYLIERAKILNKIADIMDNNIEELSELETLDQGKPLYVSRWAEIPGAIDQFRYFAGVARTIEGQTITFFHQLST